MKQFIIHSALFLTVILISCFMVFSAADGSTDAFYLKFTTQKQTSLIVGSSRAEQDIQPLVLKTLIPEYDVYNYAFTLSGTPYGEAYYRSIEKKLDLNETNGLFLVCVNPWSISVIGKELENPETFREKGNFIDRTHCVTLKPNVEYLLESYQSRNVDIILNKFKRGTYQTFFVTDEGWLQVTIESDTVSVSERTQRKMDEYRKKLDRYGGFSNLRMEYLKKTIDLFKAHGRVFLVRLPVNDEMLDMERQLMPNFDEKMTNLSNQYELPYINFIPNRNNYSYTDGHHLDINSSERLTNELAKHIKFLSTKD